MKILPYRIVKVASGLWLTVSNHFHYTEFGLRDLSEKRYTGRRLILGCSPGTAFVERDSESRSYRIWVHRCLDRQRTTYWRMVTGREPDFDREIKATAKAMKETSDPRKKQLLDCYLNSLSIANSENRLECLVASIKKRVKSRRNQYLESVISHYKNKITQMEHEILTVEFALKDHYSPEVLEAYEATVDAFLRVASCRRIWHYNERSRERYHQVYFDLGIFDYINSDTYLPLMRDSKGVNYYLLPDAILVARSSVDFDFVPLKDLTFVAQELALEEPVEVLSTRLGDAASIIHIPDLKLTFYFNHVHPIVNFVNSIDHLKKLL